MKLQVLILLVSIRLFRYQTEDKNEVNSSQRSEP